MLALILFLIVIATMLGIASIGSLMYDVYLQENKGKKELNVDKKRKKKNE